MGKAFLHGRTAVVTKEITITGNRPGKGSIPRETENITEETLSTAYPLEEVSFSGPTEIYEGDFIEGKRTGKGVFIHKGGDCYYGDSVEGISHGKGIYIWTDGERYEGDFVNGQLTGKGVFFYKNGERYEGDFVNGCKEGYGTMYYPDGRYDTGRWHDDNFMG